jgi:hypothetical protein
LAWPNGAAKDDAFRHRKADITKGSSELLAGRDIVLPARAIGIHEAKGTAVE